MKLKNKINLKDNLQFDSAHCDRQPERSRRPNNIGVKLLIVFALYFFAGTVQAQRIKATASLDSAQILIGDQVKLFLEIDHPKNVDVQFPAVPDTIVGLIEIISRSGIDTFELDDETFMKQIQAYTITSFDSGSYRIPPYWFNINMDGNIDSIPSNGVSLHVYSMQIDTTMGPTDIKMPYDAPLTLKEVTPYILGVILIGAIIFFILYSIKRKKNNKPIFSRPQKPKEPAHIIAIRELDRIKTEKVWQKGKTKQYYSEVTEALRTYIEERYEIRALEQTSDETIENFRIQKDLLNEKNFNNLSHTLKLADLVKFAKYQPLPDDDNRALTNAYFFVNETKVVAKEKPQDKEKDKGEESDDNVEKIAIK